MEWAKLQRVEKKDKKHVLVQAFQYILKVDKIHYTKEYQEEERVPRRGFNNKRFTIRYNVVNVGSLNKFEDGTVVTKELLKENGLIGKELKGLKILGSGELTKKLTVKANVFTNTAINKIEELGGKAEVI